MSKHVLRGELVGMVLNQLMSKLNVASINNTHNELLVREHILIQTLRHLVIEDDIDTISPCIAYIHDLIDKGSKEQTLVFVYLELLEHVLRRELSRIPYEYMDDIDVEVDSNGFIIITAD